MKIVNAWICQFNNDVIVPIYGDLKIIDGRIESIIPKAIEGENNYNQNSTDVINAEGRLLTIPNVNYHDHIYSSLAKGLKLKGSFSNFPEILKNLWWKLDLLLDDDMIRASAQMTAIESIKKGVTYIVDHHSSPNYASNSLRTISQELEVFGIRNILCFETTDRNGAELKEKGFEENINFLKNYTSTNSKSMLGLHASFTLEDDTLKRTAELVEMHDWSIHVHLCEDLSDIEQSLKKFGSDPLKRFYELNLLNDKSILAHGIHLIKNEFDMIKESGASVALNIDSNMNNSVGLHKYDLMKNNIPLLIGTDGMHSNIPKSIKELYLQLRHHGFSFEDSFDFIIKTIINQIKFIKRFFVDFSTLNINDRADFIIWDYIPPTPINSENFWGHYIYGTLERSVKTVVQNGKLLLKDFNLTSVDEIEYHKNIINQGTRLYNKFNG